MLSDGWYWCSSQGYGWVANGAANQTISQEGGCANQQYLRRVVWLCYWTIIPWEDGMAVLLNNNTLGEQYGCAGHNIYLRCAYSSVCHFNADGEVWVTHLSTIHFQGWFIQQVSCYTHLSGFWLPWPLSCCLDESTPFVVSDECIFWHLNLTFSSSCTTSSAYQKWPTGNSQLLSSSTKRWLILTYLKFESRFRLFQPPRPLIILLWFSCDYYYSFLFPFLLWHHHDIFAPFWHHSDAIAPLSST